MADTPFDYIRHLVRKLAAQVRADHKNVVVRQFGGDIHVVVYRGSDVHFAFSFHGVDHTDDFKALVESASKRGYERHSELTSYTLAKSNAVLDASEKFLRELMDKYPGPENIDGFNEFKEALELTDGKRFGGPLLVSSAVADLWTGRSLDDLERTILASGDSSHRVIKCLRNDRLDYVGQVLTLSKAELLRMPDFGRTSLKILLKALVNGPAQ